MALAPIIAVDLGVRPAAVVITGTPEAPVILQHARWPKWDGRILAWVEEQLEAYPGAMLFCEQTFSRGTKTKPYLRDTGRKQEQQAGFLAGYFRCEVHRVPPCSGNEAMAAWGILGRPDWAGEHDKDALCISLKALSRS
jgi:hypothetical protein